MNKELRSLLFVPAKEKMMKKIPYMQADAYILDLEESIEISKKNEALERIIDFLSKFSTKSIIVRLNKNNYENELRKLDEFEIDFMLPKFEGIEEYREICSCMHKHSFYALIETAMGMVNVREIVELKEIAGIAFGAEDFIADVRIKDRKFLTIPRNILVTYARAFRKTVYDAACFQLMDDEKFMEEVDDAYDMGFDGKMAIHPKHLSYINSKFESENINKYAEIVNRYEKENEPVMVIDGRVYENMHIQYMKERITDRLEHNK